MKWYRPRNVLFLLTWVGLLVALAAEGGGLEKSAGECGGFANGVVFGTNSVYLKQGSVIVSGDVVANDASPGPTLACSGRELCIGLGVTTPAGFAVKADSIKIKSGAVVGGDLYYADELINNGTIAGSIFPGLELPVLPILPPFVAELPRPGAEEIFVPIGESVVLPPGDYGLIDVQQNGSVVFTGGVYNVREISSGLSTRLLFEAPSEVRVAEKLELRESSVIGAQEGFPLAASDVVFYVAGINGSSGNLGATPKAAKLGLNTVVSANFYVPNGTLWIRQGAAVTGAFLARDVILGLGAQAALNSAFGNQPPTAQPRTVVTDGAPAIEILLQGSDPEGQDLTFSIEVPPTEGQLSSPEPIIPDAYYDPERGEIVQPPITSAWVTYTPFAPAAGAADSFTFSSSDPCGAVGLAVVDINPPDDPTPPPTPIDEVVARDGTAETALERPVTVTLVGDAPGEISLAFSIESEPASGTLSELTQGMEQPRRTARVTYTPGSGFTGEDSFQFRVEDAGDPASFAVGTLSLSVFGALAQGQETATQEGTPIEITLTGTPGAGAESALTRRRLALAPRAAWLDGAEVAGNVADADGDGLGDNHNDLPGPVPVLIAAGVDAEGGPGSNGTTRIQIEWDITDLAGIAEELESAQVLLYTVKGSVDSLDTTFFLGTEDQDGLLTDSDFEAPAEPLPGVVMPVPDVPQGTEGTFSFDVTEELREALQRDDFPFFSIQGRVDEELAGTGFQRGLQVRSSAQSNLEAYLQPQLAVATPGVTPPPILFSIVDLPANGFLVSSAGQVITCATVPGTQTCEEPVLLADATVTYTPARGFLGMDQFAFQADDFYSVGTAVVTVSVVAFDVCTPVGRPVGCHPAECGDGYDNDGDGLVDMADPQCSSTLDDDEAS